MEESMSVNAILAMDSNMGIGYENSLPWPHNKKDMKWFRDCTSGHVVVMGRKTWESFGNKKLPNRINVVMTTSVIEGEADLVAFGDVEDVINNLKEKYPDLHIFIIGGANLYRQALPFCDKLYVTQIRGAYKCDTFMYSQDFEGFGVQEYIDVDDDMTIQIRSRV
jgi:dihydrofolate reductase